MLRLLRGLLGVLLWILAFVMGLVALILSVTVILLPIGIPLLLLSKRLFTKAVQLLLPSSMAHPVEEMGKAARKKTRKAKDSLPEKSGGGLKKLLASVRRQRKRL